MRAALVQLLGPCLVVIAACAPRAAVPASELDRPAVPRTPFQSLRGKAVSLTVADGRSPPDLRLLPPVHRFFAKQLQANDVSVVDDAEVRIRIEVVEYQTRAGGPDRLSCAALTARVERRGAEFLPTPPQRAERCRSSPRPTAGTDPVSSLAMLAVALARLSSHDKEEARALSDAFTEAAEELVRRVGVATR